MTRQARAGDALVALAATWAAIVPIRTLFSTWAWISPALLTSLVVVVAGVAIRALVAVRWAVILTQLLTLVAMICALHLRGHLWHGHLWHGLPLADAVLALNRILYEGRMTIVTYAAPAPTNRGIVVALTIVAGLLVLAVDATAVTFRSPALAGLPLLAAYLITASNTGVPLRWYAFVIPAGLWMAMVARAGMDGIRRWSTAVPLRAGTRRRDGVDGFAVAARNLALVAVVSALVLAWAIPHPSARFLGEGLGRAPSGGGSTGSFELSTTLDLTRSLEQQSDAVVLRYRTSSARVDPLRIAVLGDYGPDGQFRRKRVYPATVLTSGSPIVGVPQVTGDDSNAGKSTFSVDSSRLAAPQIAVPDRVTQLDFPDDVVASRFSDGTVDVSSRLTSYSGTFDSATPTAVMLERSDVRDDTLDVLPGVQLPDADSLVVEPRAAARLQAILDTIVPRGARDLQAAVAIQDYLRSAAFTYSLTLAPDPAVDGQPLDPVSRFLETKVGYCQQFATAMIMLAREYGIPARMVIGFLPGSLDNGVRTIRGADAHAWPELFLEPVGWVRFEPTPGSRSGSVPSYAHAPSPTVTSGSGSSTSRPSGQRPDIRERQPTGNPSTTGLERPVWTRVGDIPTWAWVLLASILGGLGALTVPLSARLRTRRRLAAATDDATRVEVHWRDLTDRLTDLGLSTPESLTPRQTERFVAERGVLDGEDRQALGRVVATLERARYAAPSPSLPDPSADVDTVVAAVASSRRWPTRWLARIWPGSGRRALGAVAHRVISLPGRSLSAARESLTRGPE
ncbi:MAG: transglutaminase domain-containing protein [Tetrasphaera sp.]|nr:transglutaminase domain-containing protein [Tetrasphaera sp.]